MRNFFLSIVLLGTLFNSNAQNKINISVSNASLIATDSVQPFWFISNQHGKINKTGSFFNITELNIEQNYKTDSTANKFDYTWGGNLVAAFGKSNYFQLNQAYAGAVFKGWELKGGLFYNQVRYGGLSTTNGNLAQSQNSRPVPRIRFSTLDYKPLPFFKKWFRFKFEYEEGFLNDERYVDGAHLHHKSLYGKFIPAKSWNIYLGLEHYVMWGGTSRNENIGKLPDDFNAYIHYIFALPGNEDFPGSEQQNISGNQLGTYQFEIEKDFSGFKTSFYLSHPWEDNSGLNFRNWPDNLLGLHFYLKNDKKLVTDIVYEFTNTRQQSLKDSLYSWDENAERWRRNEVDNYYNHGIYRSGFTYQEQVMSSPLFYPVNIQDEISMGIRSNRFISHHLGAKGNITEHLYWKGMLTYMLHLGTYGKPFEPKQNQISGLINLHYKNPAFPVDLGLAAAADSNNIQGKNLGFQFTLSKAW
jgi:hypothetical protein